MRFFFFSEIILMLQDEMCEFISKNLNKAGISLKYKVYN